MKESEHPSIIKIPPSLANEVKKEIPSLEKETWGMVQNMTDAVKALVTQALRQRRAEREENAKSA